MWPDCWQEPDERRQRTAVLGEFFEVLIASRVRPVWMLQLWLRDVLVRK